MRKKLTYIFIGILSVLLIISVILNLKFDSNAKKQIMISADKMIELVKNKDKEGFYKWAKVKSDKDYNLMANISGKIESILKLTDIVKEGKLIEEKTILENSSALSKEIIAMEKSTDTAAAIFDSMSNILKSIEKAAGNNKNINAKMEVFAQGKDSLKEIRNIMDGEAKLKSCIENIFKDLGTVPLNIKETRIFKLESKKDIQRLGALVDFVLEDNSGFSFIFLQRQYEDLSEQWLPFCLIGKNAQYSQKTGLLGKCSREENQRRNTIKKMRGEDNRR